MSLILSGTDGLSDVDGSAATPAIRGTDANTGIFFPAADTIAFSEGGVESMRIDSSGNVGIGITSPSTPLHVQGNSSGLSLRVQGRSSDGYADISLYNNANTVNNAFFASSNTATFLGTGTTIPLAFYTNNAERMRIDSSGNLLVGTTNFNTNSNYFAFNPSGSAGYLGHANGTGSGTSYLLFQYNGASIADISQNGTTGVLYNLTSDYRLKNDQQPLTGSKEFIMALQPKKWQWWDGSGEGVGFVAHEFMQVAKHSGKGEKDATDGDGKPVYQSIQPSSSEVMANLVAFIQEQQALIQSLTARITALETP